MSIRKSQLALTESGRGLMGLGFARLRWPSDSESWTVSGSILVFLLLSCFEKMFFHRERTLEGASWWSDCMVAESESESRVSGNRSPSHLRQSRPGGHRNPLQSWMGTKVRQPPLLFWAFVSFCLGEETYFVFPPGSWGGDHVLRWGLVETPQTHHAVSIRRQAGAN